MYINYYQDKFEHDLSNLLCGEIFNTKTKNKHVLVSEWLKTNKYDNDVFIVCPNWAYDVYKQKITDLYSEPVFVTMLYGYNIYLISNKGGCIAVLVVEYENIGDKS